MAQTEPLSQELAAVLAQFPGPVAIRPSRRTELALLSLIFLFAAAFVWLHWGLPLRAILSVGVFLGIFVAPFGVVLALSYARDLPRITLDAEGFARWTVLGGSGWIRWRNVGRFTGRMGLVVYSREPSSQGMMARVTSRRALPAGLYRLTSKEIAALMAAWRERALRQR